MTNEPRGVPPGWEAVSLGDVISPSTLKVEPSEFGDSIYIGLENIESRTNRIIASGNVDSVKSTKAVFKAGDILYGKLRPYLNKVCRPQFDGVCSTDILVYPQVPQLDNGYLLYFLSSPKTTSFASQNASGINLPRIGANTLSEIDFPLPPLAEQRRIVAKIDALQERSRKAREALAEVGPLFEQFRQSLLAAAFRGDLTADWRAANPNVEPATELLNRIRQERRKKWEHAELAKYEAKSKQPPIDWKRRYQVPEPTDHLVLPEIPTSWCWCALEELATHQSGYAFKSTHFSSDGVQVIKLGNLYQGRFDLSRDPAYLPVDHVDAEAVRVFDGDILVSQTGTRYKRDYGFFVLVPPGSEPLLLNQRVLAVRPVHPTLSEWLVFSSRLDCYRDYFFSTETGGVNQGNVGVGGIMRGPIPLAPEKEVAEISRRIADAYASINEIAVCCLSSETELTQLDQSILTKAFRGELVPQDPNDEPASVLLERIRADRQSTASTKRKGAGNGRK